MGKLTANFSPAKCRRTCHRVRVDNFMGRGRAKYLWYCEGIRGPLSKEQKEAYCG